MDKQKQSKQLLRRVYRNAAMGAITVGRLIPAVKNKRLSQELKRQQNGYSHIADTAEVYLGMAGEDRPMINPIGGNMLRTNIRVNLAAGRNKPDRVTKMLLMGNAVGADTMRSQLDRYYDCDSYVRDMADKLIRFEEQNINRLQLL